MRPPKVKVRIPSFARAWAKGSTMREVFLTVLATTISIVLTFGTAALLEYRQRVNDRKMSAMMVMSNIETFSRQLEQMSKDMALRDSVGTWMLHLPVDKLDDIPIDEIKDPINMIVVLDFMSRDKTAENIFGNNIETWKNLGNFQFIDNVGRCFSEMNDMEKYWNDWVNEYASTINDVIAKMEPGEHTHTKLLSNSSVRQMIETFHTRQNWLDYVAAYCRYLNKKNMRLIGISEKEVMAFTDERTRDDDSDGKEPVVSDFRKPQLQPDSLITLRPLTHRIDSILKR